MKQKIISIFLCFVLLLSLFIMPLKANAYVAYDPASAALFSFFSASGIVSDLASATSQLISDTWHKIQVIAESQEPYFDLMNKLKAAQAGKKISFTKDELSYLQTTFKEVYLAPTFVGECYYEGNLITAENIDKIGYLAPQQEVYVPTQQAMQNISAITQEQILYLGFETNAILDSIDDTLTAGNQISFQIQEKLMQLTAYLRSAFSILGQGIDNLTYMIDDLRLTTLTQVSTLTAKVEELRLNLKSQIYALTDKVEQLRNNFLEQISSLTAKVEQFRQNVYSLLGQISTNIDSLVKVIQQGLNVTFNPPEHLQIQQQLQLQIQGFVDDFYNDSEEGRKHIVVIIGRAKDILSKYSNAFLAISAVLSKFLNLPILNELVMLSLALGIFALIVNLFSSIVSAHNSAEKAKAKQHSYKRKGG